MPSVRREALPEFSDMLKWLKKVIVQEASVAAPAASDAAVSSSSETSKRQGDEFARMRRFADAERCYRSVPESDADHAGALVMLGYVLREQGRIGEAQSVLERAVVVAADDADAHFLLASVLVGSGALDLVLKHLHRALQLRPDFDLVRVQLIVALRSSGRINDALSLCEEGLVNNPHSATLCLSKAEVHLAANDRLSAIAACNRALEINGGMVPAQQLLSRLLFDSERIEDAEASYRREIKLTPQHFGPYHMLGVLLSGAGRHAEAIELFLHAIELNPNSGATHSSLAAAYAAADDVSPESCALTEAHLLKAIELDPRNVEILFALGLTYARRAQFDRALRTFDRAIQLDPSSAKTRWARAMLWAPPISSPSIEGLPDRSGFAAELVKFESWWAGAQETDTLFVGELQPFYLSYQEQDNKPLMQQYGRICAQAMRRWADLRPSIAYSRPKTARIRLGIVSADIRVHSIWMAVVKGWLLSLDRERFEVIIFSLSARTDAESTLARSQSDAFVAGPKSTAKWVDEIREQNCDLLLYPALGLDPLTLQLASLRLAPVQINSWGHPETSGLPTIDYYLSAECFEPDGAQAYYTEQLVRLPNLGNRIQRMDLVDAPIDFPALGLDPDRPILLCPGTPFKYQPENDHVFLEIVRRVPNAQLVFFARPGDALGEMLKARITAMFTASGFRVKGALCFLRWLNFDEFHSLMRRATVMLDTIGFSGYNTAVQALECDLPLVTKEGRFLRGRLASGVLRRMGLRDLIADTPAEYVEMAVKLSTDSEFRAYIKSEISSRRSLLFDDPQAVGALQDFFASVARVARETGDSARPFERG